MYPPSILLLAAKSPQTLQIKRDMENHACQVDWTEISPDCLGRAGQRYYEIIVLDVERAEKREVDLLYQKLKTEPQLANIPLVILTPPYYRQRSLNGSRRSPVYLLAKDPWVELRLWQIIDQVHYLTYRYLGLNS